MPEGIPKKEEEKKPTDAGKNESEDEKLREKARNFISYFANFRKRRKLEREGEKPPKGEGREANEQEKKEASKGLLGLKLGGAMLVGTIALVLGGAIIGLKKLNELDEWFMKGFNSVFSGGKKA